MSEILGDVLAQRGEKEEALEQYRFASGVLNAVAVITLPTWRQDWIHERVGKINARIAALTGDART